MAVMFQFRAEGSEPAMLVVEHDRGVTRFTMRGEPTIMQVEDPEIGLHSKATPGLVASMAVPAAEVAAMAIALLEVPPIRDLIGAVPYVCWFDTTTERDAFVRLVKEQNPQIVDVRKAE